MTHSRIVKLWFRYALLSVLVFAGLWFDPAFAQDMGSESEWLIGRMVLDVQRMTAWSRGTTVPRGPVGIRLQADGAHWGFQVDAQGPIIPLRHIWDISAYARLCDVPQSIVAPRESLLPLRLLDLRATVIAVENEAVSERLRENFSDPLAHEEAAMLHAALVLRENAGRFEDTRHSLARITAHLAFAQALRGDQPFSLVGRLAQSVLLIGGGRPAEALERIQAFPGPPALPQAWTDTLLAAATRDWRRLVKERPSLLEILVAARLRLHASDGQASDSVVRYAADEKYRDLTDWHRMLLADPPSRHLVIPALNRALAKEEAELTAVWQAYRGGAPAPDYAVEVLNLMPELCVFFDDADRARVSALDLGTWSAFWQRHLCHAFSFVFAHNVLDRRFSDLRLYPFVVLQHRRTAQGVSRLVLDRAVQVVQQHPGIVNALNRQHLSQVLEAAASPEPDPLRPGAISPYPAIRLNPLPVLGPVPKVEDLLARIPDQQNWFRYPTLLGTAYDISVRERLLPPSRRDDWISGWMRLDPWHNWLRRQQLSVVHDTLSLAELDVLCGDLLHYDYQLMRDVLALLRHRPDDYAAMLDRMASIEPTAYLAKAELHLQAGNSEAAIVAMGEAIKAGTEAGRLQAYRPWLIDWYRRQDDPETARQIARQAAADESLFGMRLYARFIEETEGDAQGLYEAIHRKYWESVSLLEYLVRRGRIANDRRNDPLVLGLLKQVLMDPNIPEPKRREARQRVENIIFPGGRQKLVRLPVGKPQQGLVLSSVAAPLDKPPITSGSLVVAFDGSQVLDIFQYFLCRLETSARLAQIHIWSDGALHQVTPDLSQWDAGVKVLNWDNLPESTEDAVKQRLAQALELQPDGIIRLSLAGLKLRTLPPEIAGLSGLEALDLSNNYLSTLPDEIGSLRSLRYLDLGDNLLGSLPAALGSLKDLEYLSLKNNRLQTLPAELGSCSELRTLDLSGNSLQTLPAAMAGLQKLEALNLSQNRILDLPETFAGLRNLRRLSLQANGLKEIPLSVFGLEQLKQLYLSDNHLEVLSSGMAKMVKLEVLDLRRNLLADLPVELEGCRGIKRLLLGGNRFSAFPEVVARLENLEHLSLSSNYLRSLPSSLTRLQSLQVLAIGRNRFDSLPIETITALNNLRRLFFGGNSIPFSEVRQLAAEMPEIECKDEIDAP